MTNAHQQRRGRRVRRILSALLLGVFAWGAWGGCAPQTPTEIVTGVTTQIQVPKYLKNVGVVVRLGGRLLFCESYPVYDGTVTLPSTLGAAPPDDSDSAPSDPLTVQVLGFQNEEPDFSTDCVVSPDGGDNDTILVLRRRRLPYVDGRIVFLPMKLKESCFNVTCADENQTCIGGLCEDIDIDPATLPDYNDPLIFGNTNTCFSIERCLPDPRVPVALENLDDCTFKLLLPEDAPQPEHGNLNVQIIYNTMGSEVLDLHDKEGFILDPDDPLRFRLAPNLCESNFKTGKIIALSAGTFCPAKLEFQPICSDELAQVQAGIAGINSGFESRCVTDAPLKQTESALYVLLDSSKAMSGVFGPEGLQFALEASLKNPIAARTQVGFSPLVADPSCTQSYDPPQIDFGDVSVVREPIAQFVGDTNNVLSGDPDLGLGNAMSEAYTALLGVSPQESVQFNRRALVVIGNRDLLETCGGDPTMLAGDAFNNGIYTYVVVTDAPQGTVQNGNPLADGDAIATAGGTSRFDGTDPVEGAKAVPSIVNDLGSCVYDQPVGENGPVAVPDGATLSYLNPDPNNLVRTDIEHEPACNEANADSTNISGWNNDGQRVRICGAACRDLRDSLTDLAAGYLALGEPAPAVPMIVSVPCSLVVSNGN